MMWYHIVCYFSESVDYFYFVSLPFALFPFLYFAPSSFLSLYLLISITPSSYFSLTFSFCPVYVPRYFSFLLFSACQSFLSIILSIFADQCERFKSEICRLFGRICACLPVSCFYQWFRRGTKTSDQLQACFRWHFVIDIMSSLFINLRFFLFHCFFCLFCFVLLLFFYFVAMYCFASSRFVLFQLFFVIDISSL